MTAPRPPASLEEVLAVLRARREEVRERGVELVGVVGSVARGEDHADSDVDVVYRLVGRASLLALARALIDLKSDLGRPVDLVDLERVDAEFRVEFERDLVRA